MALCLILLWWPVTARKKLGHTLSPSIVNIQLCSSDIFQDGIKSYRIYYRTDAFVLVCCRSLAVGTKTGYKLFSLTTVEKLDCIHEGGQYRASNCPQLVQYYISAKQRRHFSLTKWKVSPASTDSWWFRSSKSCELLNHCAEVINARCLCYATSPLARCGVCEGLPNTGVQSAIFTFMPVQLYLQFSSALPMCQSLRHINQNKILQHLI